MIKFFRKIRQKLVTENKFSKYLLYAIGEIILVVFGILIALQINNWNEDKKSAKFELKMLGEIYKSLSYDNYVLKHILEGRIKVVDSSINAILTMYQNDSIEMSQFTEHAKNLEMGYIFSYSTGPYETLKIAGLDKVRNDTLRDKLIFHFDYEIPRRVNMINNDNNPSLFEKKIALEYAIFNYKIITKDGSKTFIADSYKLQDPKHPLFMEYLQRRQRATSRGIVNFESYMKDSQKIINLLLDEFDKRNYPKPEFILL